MKRFSLIIRSPGWMTLGAVVAVFVTLFAKNTSLKLVALLAFLLAVGLLFQTWTIGRKIEFLGDAGCLILGYSLFQVVAALFKSVTGMSTQSPGYVLMVQLGSTIPLGLFALVYRWRLQKRLTVYTGPITDPSRRPHYRRRRIT